MALVVDCSGNGLVRLTEAIDDVGGFPTECTPLVSNAKRSIAFTANVLLAVDDLYLCRGIGIGAYEQLSLLSMLTKRSFDGRGGIGMRGGTGGVVCIQIIQKSNTRDRFRYNKTHHEAKKKPERKIW